MAGCSICNASSDLAYRCNYCGASHCEEHRLPENHDCFVLVVMKHINNSWFDTPDMNFRDVPDEAIEDVAKEIRNTNFEEISKTEGLSQYSMAKKAVHKLCQKPPRSSEQQYTTYEPEHTVGTSKEPEYESSPDVDVHGGIKRSDKEAEADDPESESNNQGVISKILSWIR